MPAPVKQLTARIPRPLAAAFIAVTKERGVSMESVICDLIREYTTAHYSPLNCAITFHPNQVGTKTRRGRPASLPRLQPATRRADMGRKRKDAKDNPQPRKGFPWY